MTLGPQSIGIGPQEIGGGGGGSEAIDYSVAQASITHPSPAILVPVTGTGDPDLNPVDGGYVPVLDEYTIALEEGSGLTVLPDGRIQFNRDGVAVVSAYADVAHSSNNSTAGATFVLYRGAATVFSGRSVHARLPNAGDIGNISGAGSLSVLSGDILGIAFASDITGNLSIRTSSVVIQLLDNTEMTASSETRSNYVLVRQKSDFPNPVGGVITLASNTDYEINGSIDLTGDRIELSGSNVIFGQNPELDILLTSNATSLIEGRDSGLISDNLAFVNTTGPVFDVADLTTPSTNSVFISGCVISNSLSVGSFTDLLIVQFEKNAFQSLSDGVKISGANNTGVRFNGNIVENTVTGTLIDLGVSVTQAISADHNFIESSVGLVFLSGAVDSGNISATGQGTVISNTTFGGNLPTITGIAIGDIRWEFATNNTIADSVNSGLLQFSGNGTNTIIGSSGTDVKIAGTYSSGNLLRYESPVNGTLRYVGGKAVNSIISVTATCEVVAFISTTEVRFRIYLNGSPLAGAQVTTTASSGDLISASITSNTILQNGDEIEVYVSNLGSTQNILVTDLTVSSTS